VKKLLFVAVTLGLLASQGIAGQPKRGSIQGVWQVVEVTITGPGARTIAIPEPRPNLTIITARHYSRVEDTSHPRGRHKGERRRVAGGVGVIRGRSRHV
jgi:hypothetical protein